MPADGSQRSSIEKMTMSISPTQNSGVAKPMVESIEMASSTALPRERAASAPRKTPITRANTIAVSDSNMVAGRRSRMRSITGMFCRNE